MSVFDKELDFDYKMEFDVYFKLVYLYEKIGKSDEVIKYCIVIVKMVFWKES